MSKSCKDCLHYSACRCTSDRIISGCTHFAARSEWVHLPCKVGDIFFRTIPWRNTIDKCTVSSLTQKADKTWKIRLTSGIFRTTEEAEKALEEKK